MRITRYTDYALRVLIYLGLKGECLSTIAEIAERYDISRNHLMKVVHELQRLGYVDTLRGKHGGIRLRSPPEKINLGKLVRETEQDLELVECFNNANRCVITPACDLKFVFGEALQAFLGVLDDYTLADLLKPKRRQPLKRSLSIDFP